MILGEASAFEEAELRRMIDADPILQEFEQSQRALHGLVGEAIEPVSTEEWQLSAKRRKDLLQQLGLPQPATPPMPVIGPRKRRNRIFLIAAAAGLTLAAGLVLLSLSIPAFGPFRQFAPELAANQLPNASLDRLNEGGDVLSVVAESAAEPELFFRVAPGEGAAPLPGQSSGSLASSGMESSGWVNYGAPITREKQLEEAAASQSAPIDSEVFESFAGGSGKGSGMRSSSSVQARKGATDHPVGQRAAIAGSAQVTGGREMNAPLAEAPAMPREARRMRDFQGMDADGSVVQVDERVVRRELPANRADEVEDLLLQVQIAYSDSAVFGGKETEEAPVLGDVPVVGRLMAANDETLKTESSREFKKELDKNEGRQDKPAAKSLKPTQSREVASPALPEPVRKNDTFTLAANNPTSTFSLNVSDVSYQVALDAILNQNTLPDPNTIRIEEFTNAFDYGDPAPTAHDPVALAQDQLAHPNLPSTNLLRLTLRTAAEGRGKKQPLNLTVLLDGSGSMERHDRSQAVANALASLAKQLSPQDQVSLIRFDRQARLTADRKQGDTISADFTRTQQEVGDNGTNLEEALSVASEHATRIFNPNAINRIVVLTDGIANLGSSLPEPLEAQVKLNRARKISTDVVGIGTRELEGQLLEKMARHGDGRHLVVTDNPQDANRCACQLAGACRPTASNVKLQVEFNPNRVEAYRLMGFEEHLLKKEDFKNDRIDAAELTSAEDATAIYQIRLRSRGSGEIGTVSIRFRDLAADRMVERTWTIPYQPTVPSLEEAPAPARLAAISTLLAEGLTRPNRMTQDDLSRLLQNTESLRETYPAEQIRPLSDSLRRLQTLTPNQ